MARIHEHMLYDFHLVHYLSPCPELSVFHESDFVLHTCQRSLWISLLPQRHFSDGAANHHERERHHKKEIYQGEQAYLFLLELLCGLKSRLVGEHEILGQFRKAYGDYVSSPYRDARLMRIFEKALKDAKSIRAHYMEGITQKTYAAIARQKIMKKHSCGPVLILGSGQLAHDIIHQISDKVSLFICGRNEEKVRKLCAEHDVQQLEWNIQRWAMFPRIINTIGGDFVLLDESFFNHWMNMNTAMPRTFLDLGAPSCIRPADYYPSITTLEEILQEAQIKDNEKIEKLSNARDKIGYLAQKRWEQLSCQT